MVLRIAHLFLPLRTMLVLPHRLQVSVVVSCIKQGHYHLVLFNHDQVVYCPYVG